MPIEIKELHIKINVPEATGQRADNNDDRAESASKIIEACVEQVMEILERKKER